jgi:hypothetical protein
MQSVQRLPAGWITEESEFESPKGQEYSLFYVIETDSRILSASYPMRIGSSYPGVKWQEREADHSPPTSAEVTKTWIYTSTPPYVFKA